MVGSSEMAGTHEDAVFGRLGELQPQAFEGLMAEVALSALRRLGVPFFSSEKRPAQQEELHHQELHDKRLECMPERLHGLSAESVRDILTEASEQLPAYMEHGFTYWLNDQGADLLADTKTSVGEVIDSGIADAEIAARSSERWRDELFRRKLERRQHDMAVAYARDHGAIEMTSFSLDGGNAEKGWFGEEPLRRLIAQLAPDMDIRALQDAQGRLDPNRVLATHFESDGALWFVSMTPMHVRESGKALDGAYDPRRLKTLVRVVTPPKGGEVNASSLTEKARTAYDGHLREVFGGDWYGGRPIPKVTAKNSLHFIMQHPDLIDAHLQRVSEATKMPIDQNEMSRLLTRLQYDFVAAIDARLEGRHVESLAHAGQEARAMGKTYESDCPTRELTTEEKLRLQGLMRNKKPCCPICDSPDIVVDPLDPVCGDKECRNCGSEVVGGKVIKRARHKMAKKALEAAESPRPKKREPIRRISEMLGLRKV